jgi:pentatricopeptide repeat domain-containing protein 1
MPLALQQGAGRGEGERGQGYRKLWQQVTKVGRGQKLGDNSEAVPFSDMTVEDLLRIIRALPPEDSAVAAVSRGLFYLDSRALAALLKELHKVGLSNRCARGTCTFSVSALAFPERSGSRE